MKKLHFGIFLICFHFIGTSLTAQIQNSSGELIYFVNYSIRYAEGDTTLSKEGKELIDTIFQKILVKHKDTLSFFYKREIILNSFTTASEREMNRLIGIQRCFIILDYIEKKYGVRRSKLLIRDFEPSPNYGSEIGFVFPPPRAPRSK